MDRPRFARVDNLLAALSCPVCFETVKHCVITPCGHSFCRRCAGDAVSRKHVCPVCQAAVVGGEAALVRNFLVDEATEALHKAAEDTDMAYMRLLFANATAPGKATPASPALPSCQPPFPTRPSTSTGSSPTGAQRRTKSSTEGGFDGVVKKGLGGPLRPSHAFSPIEAILVDRMRDAFLGYQSFYTRELEAHEAEVASLTVRLDARTAEALAMGGEGESGAAMLRDTKALKTAIEDSKRRFATSTEALLWDFDAHVAASAPPPSLLPATVTVIVASKGVRFDTQLLPTHFPENIYAKVRAFFATYGDEVRSFGDGIRLYLQLLSSTTNRKAHEGIEGMIHPIDSPTSTVFRQSPGGRVGAGWALVVEGPILLASEVIKPCFAARYGRAGRDPQERVDYFTCGQCKLNWVCASCTVHCHRSCEGVRPFAMNHLPSWGCCYCWKKRAKTGCKLTEGGEVVCQRT